ncbi:MAG TPA: choice-of-anchor D domain-containing protein [Terriglobia bacterium]|nr:choice-of-anchor D domain-containing protein [Terriglobia bacterium]
MQTKVLRQQLVKTAILLATIFAFAVFPAFCGEGINPGAGLSATSEAFGSQVINTTTAVKSVTLTSTGTTNLSVSSITIAGTNASDFAETNNCPASMAPGAKCTIKMTYTPTVLGAETASLTVTDNASNSPQTATLTGTGIVPAKVSPTSLSFGKVPQSTASTAKTIRFYNKEAVSLAITSIATGNLDFTETNTCDQSIAAKSDCTITVTFTPSIVGAETGTLSVTDAASNSPQTATLTGTGIAQATVSPTSLTFAAQTVGTTSAAKNVTLTNNHSTALTISKITFTGAYPSDFVQTNTCGSSVAAGGSCTIATRFTPSASGTRAATLSIAANTSVSPDTLSLTGTGIVSVENPTISGISVTTGPTAGGTSLILTGVGFEQGAKVSFGGTPATSVSVLSSTQIQATTPLLSAGTVSVTITNPDGGNVALPNSFTFDDSSFWQFLDQFQNGIARNASKPYSLLERGKGTGIYQPDMLIFQDTTTGNEVWRLDNDPRSTWIPGVLNRTPWNTNGSLIGLGSNRCILEVYCGDMHNYLYDARGGLQRLIMPTDPTRQPAWTQNQLVTASGQYMPWDRVNPNLLYTITADDTNRGYWPNPLAILYSVDVSNKDTMTIVLDLPNPTLTKELQSYLSEDNVLMAQDVNPGLNSSGSPLYIPDIYMVDMNTNRPTYGTLLYQYGINFGLTAPNHSQSNEYHFHDIYFRRTSTDSYIFNYGPKGSVGEPVFFEMPLNGNPLQANLAYPDATYSTPYYSHPAWNYTGTLVSYDGEEVLGDNIYGSWVRNHDEHLTLAKIGISSGHMAWDGYDPNFIAFDNYTVTTPTHWQLQDANPNGTSTRTLMDDGPRDANTSPGLLYGPAQSPDATKVASAIPDNWTSSTAKIHTYITVSHRPFPPVLAVVSTSPVTLQWTPYLTSREVSGFHVYRSPDGKTSFHEISTGLVSGTSFIDNNASAEQMYFYAVTAEEYSGLESNQLSNIMQVTVGGASSQFAPAGTTGWDTVAPAPPTNVGLSNLAPGVWKLTWTASASSDTRYYNIFYNTGSAPPPTQPFAVDSPPVYETSYIYWQADPDSTPLFGIQAVDRQGNQSSMVCLAGTSPPGPCF